MPSQRKPKDPELEGDGNRSADRHYREAASKHATSDASKRAIQAAERAPEGDEKEELEAAEVD
jgi:hypothetical protein